jgi:hypothetical protein
MPLEEIKGLPLSFFTLSLAEPAHLAKIFINWKGWGFVIPW